MSRQRRDHRVSRCDLSELAGEVGLLLGAQVLVRKKQHQVPAQSGAHLRHDCVPERPRQVQTEHLGTDVGRQPSDIETRGDLHRPIVPQ